MAQVNSSQSEVDSSGKLLPIDAKGSFWSYPKRAWMSFVIIYLHPHEFLEKIVRSHSIFKPAFFGMLTFSPILILLELIPAKWCGVFWRVGSNPFYFHQEWIQRNFISIIVGLILYVLIYGLILMIFSLIYFSSIFIWKGNSPSTQLSLRQTIRLLFFIAPLILLISYLPTQLGLVFIGRVYELILWLLIGIGLARIYKIQPWKGIGGVFTPIVIYYFVYRLMNQS